MSSTELMKWALLVDVAILIALCIDVYFTYQNYQNNQQRGH